MQSSACEKKRWRVVHAVAIDTWHHRCVPRAGSAKLGPVATPSGSLSLHDALPIYFVVSLARHPESRQAPERVERRRGAPRRAPLRHGHAPRAAVRERSEEHTSELQSQSNLVCSHLRVKKKGGELFMQSQSTRGTTVVSRAPVRRS